MTDNTQSRGSPAYHYGLAPTNFITAVNGIPTPTLDDFVKEVRKITDNTYFRLRAVTFDNVPWVVSMKKNDHYVSLQVCHFPGTSSNVMEQFPMSEYIKDSSVPAGWRTISYDKPEDNSTDAANLNPEAMDEVFEGGASDVEPDTD